MVHNNSELPEPLSVLGTKVVPFESYSHALKCIEDSITCGRKSFCVAINCEKVYRAVHDSDLQFALSQANVAICDGVGIALAVKLLYGQTIRLCTGVDLFFQLISIAGQKGWKVFLLGANRESNEKACSNLIARYPDLQIVGRRDGYFKDPNEVVEQINASRADLLFVAMGSPKQELWIAKHHQAISAAFCMGVGGAFDVASGKARRAPKIFRKTGTEGLFRLVANPGWKMSVRWRRMIVKFLFVRLVVEKRFFDPKNML